MENKKANPKEIVERYHNRYLEYEKAFNSDPFNREDMKTKLQEMVSEGVDTDSEEFQEEMMEIMIEKPQKRADVNNAALKFFFYTEFYLSTETEPLPETLLEDYNSLPLKKDLAPFYSIENGLFVKNEEQEISEEHKKYFKEIIKQIPAE